jgi:NAD(P)H-flavin reductase
MRTPWPATVRDIVQETPDVFTITVDKKEGMPTFSAGQFMMLYLFGYGESAISLAGDPKRLDFYTFTVRATGSVTDAIARLKPLDTIGLRGPYGNGWPLEHHRDIVMIAGGVGIASLRSTLFCIALERHHYRKVTLLYGARAPEDVIYKEELSYWKQFHIEIILTVDTAGESWHGHVGVVPSLVAQSLQEKVQPQIFICGPEVMIRFTIHELLRHLINKDDIYFAMERHMQCGTGMCGRCQMGTFFLCKDGPIFSYKELERWLWIKEL